MSLSDNLNNVCNSQAYINSEYQKKQAQLLNNPGNRYNNLANNPYQRGFTKFDLDMRRKAEILQYSSSRMSTQTNSLTNAQKYAQAVNGTYQRRTFSTGFINANISENNVLQVCPPGTIIKTPSNAAGVPGPPINLYLDPAVPLYNLLNDIDTNAYGIINTESNKNLWDYTDVSNIICQPTTNRNNYAKLTSIYMYNVTEPAYTFTISFPINIYISATSKPIQPIPVNKNISGTFYILDISFAVFYSLQGVTLQVDPLITFDTSYNSLNPIQLDISANTQGYSANIYAGKVTLSNINLYAQIGYIYDIGVSNTFSISSASYNTFDPSYSDYFNGPSILGVLNTTQNTQTSSNLKIRNPITIPTPFPKFTFSGI